MDKKLQEYRARKNREALIAKAKDTVKSFLPTTILYNGLRNRGHNENRKLDESDEPLLLHQNDNHLSDDEEPEHRALTDDEIDQVNCFTYKQFAIYVAIFTVWALVYAQFINWGFGSVYFIVTALIGMYFNTRTTRKKKGEVSAYSVFNKNCESIKGTVKAEDLERQMIYGQLF